jgi:hypothetical protein
MKDNIFKRLNEFSFNNTSSELINWVNNLEYFKQEKIERKLLQADYLSRISKDELLGRTKQLEKMIESLQKQNYCLTKLTNKLISENRYLRKCEKQLNDITNSIFYKIYSKLKG